MTVVLQNLAERLSSLNWMLATAESCTGGMIAARCTDLAGSSIWFDRGFVTYSNAAKSEMLGVLPELITMQGAVSEAVARAMAWGAICHSHAQVSVAVTGIAGPSGGTLEKPVGTVWLAWAVQGQISAQVMHFEGDRQHIRECTTLCALKGVLDLLPV